MKKTLIVIMAVIVVGVSGLSFAQMNDKDKGMMGKDGMMGGKNMMGMMAMCHAMMNKPSIASVSDGVVVLSGKKLYKYDANLNLIKEAEIKLDETSMMGDMSGNKEKTAEKSGDEHAAHHPEQ